MGVFAMSLVSDMDPSPSGPVPRTLISLLDVTADLAVELIMHLHDHGLALVGLAVAGDERDLDGEYAVIHALDLEPDGIGIFGAGIYRRPRLLDLLARHDEAQGLAGPLGGLHGRLQLRVV